MAVKPSLTILADCVFPPILSMCDSLSVYHGLCALTLGNKLLFEHSIFFVSASKLRHYAESSENFANTFSVTALAPDRTKLRVVGVWEGRNGTDGTGECAMGEDLQNVLVLDSGVRLINPPCLNRISLVGRQN